MFSFFFGVRLGSLSGLEGGRDGRMGVTGSVGNGGGGRWACIYIYIYVSIWAIYSMCGCVLFGLWLFSRRVGRSEGGPSLQMDWARWHMLTSARWHVNSTGRAYVSGEARG